MMSPVRLNNCTLELQNSVNLDNPAAFERPLFDRLRLTLALRYLPVCTLDPSHHPPTVLKYDPLLSPLEPGARFSFDLTQNRGAALVTKYATYRMDALVELAFEKYTKRHYESWVDFARDKEFGNDVHPVLVSGFDMTQDFAMVAYSDNDVSLGADLTITVPVIASASTSIWGTWHTRCTPHINQGPQLRSLLSREQTIGFPSQLAGVGNIPAEFNQCVFIRYFTMRSRGPFGLFPRVIKAGAGPHDLGSGDNERDTFPELTAQSDVDLSTSDDQHSRGQWVLTPDGGLESDVVVRNTPYVRFPLISLSCVLIFTLRIRDMTAGVPLQIMYFR